MKSMKLIKIFALAGLALGGIMLASCEHESEQVHGTTKVCFPSEVLPIIVSNCNMSGCHTGGGELPALSTYNDILRLVVPGQPSKSKLHDVLTANQISEKFMPAGADPLPKKYMDLISLWILQGAKDLDTSNVQFTATILPVFKANCERCHSGTMPSGGILLTDYTTIKECAVSGRLLGTIQQLPGFSAMPQGADKLCDCNIAEITNWINIGMPNN
jgi:hypothetical protein